MKRVHVLLTVWVTALIVTPGSTRAAEITVLSDSPLAPALARIAEAFRRDSGHEVKFVFGLSPVIHKRVIDGETGDVVIIQPNFINDLVSAGKIVAGQYPIIARIGIGLFTRADANGLDVSTVPAFKQALLNADTLVFTNVAGAITLLRYWSASVSRTPSRATLYVPARQTWWHESFRAKAP